VQHGDGQPLLCLRYSPLVPIESETAVSAATTPPAKQPPDSVSYHFYYLQPDGNHDTIGSWSPPRLDQSADGIVHGRFVHTADPAEAEHWRAELAAGRLPIDIENDS
jgi:hypothetical protein